MERKDDALKQPVLVLFFTVAVVVLWEDELSSSFSPKLECPRGRDWPDEYSGAASVTSILLTLRAT